MVTEKKLNPLILAGGFAALMSAMGLGRFYYTPMVPVMQGELGITTDMAGWIAGANFTGYLIGTLWAMMLKDSIVRWRMNTLGVLLCAAATVGTGLSHDPYVIGLMRALAGFGSAMVMVLCVSLVFEATRHIDDKRASGVAVSGIGGGIIASGVIALVLGQTFDWTWFWWLGGSLALALAAFSIIAIPCPKETPAVTPTAEHIRWWHNSSFLFLTVAYFLEGLGYVVTATFLVTILKTGGLSDAAGNTALVVVGLAALPSTWIWGRVSSRIGGHKALAIAYTFMAIGIVLPVFDASVPTALISAALFGATFLGIVAMTVAVGAEMMPHARTFAIGILSTAFGLGQLVGPILAGEATILFGNFTAALLGAGTVTILGLICMLISKYHFRPQAPQSV
jgi:predicted MFS family arabinose efflux permease